MGKRIVIVTDSLGMPRGEPDNISLEETWPYMLFHKYQKDHEVFFFPQRAMTTRELITKSTDCITLMKPDVVVIQVGIVDSCRRIFPRRITLLLGILRLYDAMYKHFFKKNYYRWTKLFKTQLVKAETFRSNVGRILSDADKAEAKCIFIAVAPPGDYARNMVYNILDDIKEYNAVLEEETRKRNGIFANPYAKDEPGAFLLRDGQHLNLLGAKYVFDEVDEIIQNILEETEGRQAGK